jgi:hypothetical protein
MRPSWPPPPTADELTIQGHQFSLLVRMAEVAIGAITSGSACHHYGVIRTDLIPQPTYSSNSLCASVLDVKTSS